MEILIESVMPTPHALLARLNAIGLSLERSGHALALIGLGSVGEDLDRLDAFSDLDFFAIVEDQQKSQYLESLDWLESICPIAFQVRNTADGYKVLFDDGIFAEFAVFEPAELTTIPFARGRIVWKQPHVDNAIRVPQRHDPSESSPNTARALGEALTNLYVGLGRFHRGERLSAARFIQQFAVDRIVELAPIIEPAKPVAQDRFAPERRLEERFPQLAQQLPLFVQGYDQSPASALAILAFLEEHFDVNAAMAAAIRRLAQGAPATSPKEDDGRP